MSTYTDEISQTKDKLGLDVWLPAHHNEPMEGVHVFVVAGGSMFGEPEADQRFDFDVQFNVLGITLILKGYVDLTNFAIDAGYYARIPLFPDIFLARVVGNLKVGVTVAFNIVGVIAGTSRFYIKNTWDVWVDLQVRILRQFIQGDFYLLTLPH